MEKKSAKSETVSLDNSSGVVSVVFGILSVIFSILPIVGIVFGVIAFFFGQNQSKKSFKGWGKEGTILAAIGVILSLVIWFVAAKFLMQYIPNTG